MESCKYIIVTLLLAGLLLPVALPANDGFREDLRFHHLTTSHGLPHPWVTTMEQDDEGFLWIGTQNGLSRYDGYEMIAYPNIPGDPYSLRSNAIRIIYQDINGLFWVGTNSGLHLYDRRNDHFVHVTDNEDDSGYGLDDQSIYALLRNDDKTMWVGTGNGLKLLNTSHLTVERIIRHDPDSGGLSHPDVRALWKDTMDNLWIGTSGGLNLFKPEQDTVISFTHDPADPGSLPADFVNVIREDRHGILWIGTQGGGLAYFDYKAEKFIHVSAEDDVFSAIPPGGIVHDIYEDSKGYLWVGTELEGVVRIDPERSKAITYEYDPENPYSVNDGAIHRIYENRDGILYFATQAGGLCYLDQNHFVFSHFLKGDGKGDGLSNNMIRSFKQDDTGDIWIANHRGLNRFDPETNYFESFRHQPDNLQSIPSDVILNLHLNNKGLWIGTYGGGFSIMDIQDHTFRHYRQEPDNPNSLSSNAVFSLYEDRDGMVWIATNGGGLNRFDPVKERFTRYLSDLDDTNSIGNNDVRAIFEDRDGELWIGTYSGALTRFERSEERFYHYDINEELHFPNNVVQTFLEDSSGRFWLASRGGGLILFDRDRMKVDRVYTVNDGLPGNNVQSILEDDQGIIWLTTNNGLSRFDPEMEIFQNHDETAGVQKSDFFYNSSLIDHDGYIYFGGYNGFNRFHPGDIEITHEDDPILLTDFQLSFQSVPVGGDSPLPGHISRIDSLFLPHDVPMITFRFSALNFSATKNNRFAYMLEGLDSDWIYSGSQRLATYTNLNPGEYRFKVKATNNDGVWSEHHEELALIITPPFWQADWFLALASLSVVSLLFAGYRLRVRAINARNRKLRRVIAERTRELEESGKTKDTIMSIIAHDINNVAFGIIGFVELLRESVDNNNMKEVKEYTGRLEQSTSQFHNMLKNLLNWARSQSGKIEIDPKPIPIAEMVDEHVDSEKHRASGKSITLYSSVNTDQNLIVCADRNLLSTVLRNLIHNAIKFTYENGRIEIAVTDYESYVEVAVIDDGVGISTDQMDQIQNSVTVTSTKGTGSEKGTGLGLAVVKDFIHKNNGEFTITSGEGKGSRFAFTLPKCEERNQSNGASMHP